LKDYKTSEYKEHVTKYLYDNPGIGLRKYYTNESYNNLEGKQLAVDTKSDFDKLSEIYRNIECTISDESTFMNELNLAMK